MPGFGGVAIWDVRGRPRWMWPPWEKLWVRDNLQRNHAEIWSDCRRQEREPFKMPVGWGQWRPGCCRREEKLVWREPCGFCSGQPSLRNDKKPKGNSWLGLLLEPKEAETGSGVMEPMSKERCSLRESIQEEEQRSEMGAWEWKLRETCEGNRMFLVDDSLVLLLGTQYPPIPGQWPLQLVAGRSSAGLEARKWFKTICYNIWPAHFGV